MKQFLIISTLLLSSFIINAQSEKYQATMQKNIALIDSAKTNDKLIPLANTFERIGDAEKTEWLPYYYAAFCQTMIVRNNIQQKAAQKDPTALDAAIDKGESLIAKAESLDKENSETDVLKSMLATSRIMVEPMTRGQKFGPLSGTYLQKAIQLDSTNPRPVLISGMNKYYTPEQWGGDKKKAIELFKKADEMDKNFKPASALHPAWGRGLIDYMLKMSQKLTQ